MHQQRHQVHQQMDPKNQQPFNANTPISEVLKQEQTGYTPSVPNHSFGTVPFGPVAKDASQVAEDKKVQIIKTFKSDAADAAKMQQASMSKLVIAEEQQRREKGIERDGAPKRHIGLVLLVLVLLILGAAAIPTVNYILNQKKAEVPVVLEKSIIPFDSQEDIILDKANRENFLLAIDTIFKKPTTSSVERFKIFEKIEDVKNKKTFNQIVSPEVFAGIIGPNMPSALARSFDSDYMYGIANTDSQRPFILFKTSSYQQTFANMLKWEPKMATDLSLILNLAGNASDGAFLDKILVNKDVRAVVSPDGTIVFLYGFLDNQTLLITKDAQTFQEVNTKYVSTHFVQ